MSFQRVMVAAASLAAAALCLSAFSATASAKVPVSVRLSAKTSVSVQRLSDGGAKFTGKIRFRKIRPAIGHGKIPKKMKKAAKRACYALYAGGVKDGREPWVKVNQGPVGAALTLNLYANAVFKKSGKWITSGLHPKNSQEPFKGKKVTVYGGFYDQYRNFRANFMSKNFKYKGKNREALCEEFQGTYKP